METIKNDYYYNVKDVAEILNISIYTLRLWLKDGKIKGVKIGRVWKIKGATIQELVK